METAYVEDEKELDVEDVIQRRCKRCKKFLTGKEWNTKCYYHPGTFTDFGFSSGWSCCNRDILPCINMPDLIAFQEEFPKAKGINLTDLLNDATNGFRVDFIKFLAKRYKTTKLIEAPETGENRPDSSTIDETVLSPSLELQTVSTTQSLIVHENNAKLAIFTEKRMNETMNMNEKLQHRDDPILSPLAKESIGCTIRDNHLEDEEYSANLGQFPIDLEAAKAAHKEGKLHTRIVPQEIVNKKLGDTRHPLQKDLLLLENKKEVGTTEVAKEGEEEKEDEGEKAIVIPEFFEHIIQEGDTLPGLSLKYDVPVRELQRINFLGSTQQVFHLKSIRIPTKGKSIPPQQISSDFKKKEALRRFQKKTGVSLEEAKFYLEETDFDEETALQTVESEKEWENSSKVPFRPSTRHKDSNSQLSSSTTTKIKKEGGEQQEETPKGMKKLMFWKKRRSTTA